MGAAATVFGRLNLALPQFKNGSYPIRKTANCRIPYLVLIRSDIFVVYPRSTIRKAERIYVLQNGRIVRQGAFDEPPEIEGPFKEPVQRQMA